MDSGHSLEITTSRTLSAPSKWQILDALYLIIDIVAAALIVLNRESRA